MLCGRLDGRGVWERMDTCVYGWAPLLSIWNYHNIVNWLYSSAKWEVKKKKGTCGDEISLCYPYQFPYLEARVIQPDAEQKLLQEAWSTCWYLQDADCCLLGGFLHIGLRIYQIILRSGQLRTSVVAQMVKNLPAMQEAQVQSLGREDALWKEMATHSNILTWRISWTEKPGGLQSMLLQSQTWLSN